ncbi:MAG: nuclear transport factor 2 family protein [Mycobacterium sp.]
MEIWELVARERIRDTLARYNWSGDSARVDDLTAAFTADGELEVRSMTTVKGRNAIAGFLGGVVTAPAEPGSKRIVRHALTNIRFTEVTPERAQVSSYFTVFTEIGLDHYGRYRDIFVPSGDDWLIQSRFVATDWSAPNSTMT